MNKIVLISRKTSNRFRSKLILVSFQYGELNIVNKTVIKIGFYGVSGIVDHEFFVGFLNSI